jgi:hypothetical protein
MEVGTCGAEQVLCKEVAKKSESTSHDFRVLIDDGSYYKLPLFAKGDKSLAAPFSLTLI